MKKLIVPLATLCFMLSPAFACNEGDPDSPGEDPPGNDPPAVSTPAPAPAPDVSIDLDSGDVEATPDPDVPWQRPPMTLIDLIDCKGMMIWGKCTIKTDDGVWVRDNVIWRKK